MTSKNKRKVIRTLTIGYNFLQKPVPFFLASLILTTIGAVYIHVFSLGLFYVSSSSALQVLSCIVESSATILGIFFATLIFLIGDPREIRYHPFNALEFATACITFSAAIFLSLLYMLNISDKPVDSIATTVPAFLLFASLSLLFVFSYRLLRRAQKRRP